MAAPNSAVDICNLALDLLGEKKIASIVDYIDSTSDVMARWYDNTRLQMLREFNWNFAKKRETLSRLTDAPEFDYDDAYLMPSDLVRLVSIGEDYYEISDYDITGRTLYCNNDSANSLQIRYIANIEDVTLFDSLFLNCFAQRLALNTAYRFELKASAVERLNAQYTLDIRAAVGVDGQEKPVRIINVSPAVQARRNRRPRYTYDKRYL